MPAAEPALLTGNPEVSAFSFFIIFSYLVRVTWLQFSCTYCDQILPRLNIFLQYNNIYPSSDCTSIWAFQQAWIWNLASVSHGFACVMVISLCLLPFNDILSSEKTKLHGAISDD